MRKIWDELEGSMKVFFVLIFIVLPLIFLILPIIGRVLLFLVCPTCW